MNDFLEFLVPFDRDKVKFDPAQNDILGSLVRGIEELEKEDGMTKIAVVGVNEDRKAGANEGCSAAPDYIRNKLYNLKIGSYRSPIIDVGNIKTGHEVNDTYFALSRICSNLLKRNVFVLILGGSQDLTYAQYLAYKELEQTVNLVTVDSTFDLGFPEDELNTQSYLGKIVLHQPNYLFNFSNIGFQSYFVGEESIRMMEKLYFDAYRLGVVRENIENIEPVVRNADLLSVDISSVRQSDAPGNANASPNGFYGEEICQIARYAGFSDKLTSVGFYEVNPAFDLHHQTSHLTAQMIWYFLEGFQARIRDLPVSVKNGFLKYRVSPKNSEYELVFYKSRRSEKWWMEIPYLEGSFKRERQHIIPCSYDDYQMACNEEIPERWWQAYKKLV
jgi:formiminoglutamase